MNNLVNFLHYSELKAKADNQKDLADCRCERVRELEGQLASMRESWDYARKRFEKAERRFPPNYSEAVNELKKQLNDLDRGRIRDLDAYAIVDAALTTGV